MADDQGKRIFRKCYLNWGFPHRPEVDICRDTPTRSISFVGGRGQEASTDFGLVLMKIDFKIIWAVSVNC